MTTAQAVETSVTVNNNRPIQECVHLDYHTQPTSHLTKTNVFLILYDCGLNVASLQTFLGVRHAFVGQELSAGEARKNNEDTTILAVLSLSRI